MKQYFAATLHNARASASAFDLLRPTHAQASHQTHDIDNQGTIIGVSVPSKVVLLHTDEERCGWTQAQSSLRSRELDLEAMTTPWELSLRTFSVGVVISSQLVGVVVDPSLHPAFVAS